jgi:hypothetical protein
MGTPDMFHLLSAFEKVAMEDTTCNLRSIRELMFQIIASDRIRWYNDPEGGDDDDDRRSSMERLARLSGDPEFGYMPGPMPQHRPRGDSIDTASSYASSF